MKPQHFEILSEKQNASEEEAKSNLTGKLEVLECGEDEQLNDYEGGCQANKQANLTEGDE